MLLILLMLIVSLAVPAHADEEFIGSREPGTGEAGFRVEFYDNPDDMAGNPFLLEELTVIEAALVLDYNVSDRLGTHAQFSYDYVSSASIKRLSAYPQQSGASGDYYYGLDLGLNYELSPRTRVGGFTSASIEYDYFSFGLGGDFARDSEDHSSTLRFTTNGFFDVVKVIRFNGVEEGTDQRLSLTGSLVWYQIINRDTHGELGLSMSLQSGFLETAFNAVVIEDETLPPNPALENLARGYEITEELPGTRVRTALFGQIRHALGVKNAAGLHMRVYGDTWGIQSFTVEPRFYHWIIPGRLNARLRYRYYVQTAADAYGSSFLVETEERTQDSDLADFDSHGAGLRLALHLDGPWTFDVLADYTWRSDGIDQFFGGSGFRRSF